MLPEVYRTFKVSFFFFLLSVFFTVNLRITQSRRGPSGVQTCAQSKQGHGEFRLCCSPHGCPRTEHLSE